jgi:hypothetical protein
MIPVLTSEQVQSIHVLEAVIQNRAMLTAPHQVVTFTCELTSEIKDAIYSALGLQLSEVTHVPMRWIQGDTLPHVDAAGGVFEYAYVVYLSSSEGHFYINDQTLPIMEGYGIHFNEGARHGTQSTGTTPRLLIGPLNEHGQPIGSAMSYYASESDALNYTNPIGYGSTWTVESFNGITAWRLAPNSSGTSSQSATYYVGDQMNPNGSYNFYPNAPCLLEGSTVSCLIDHEEKEIPIEQIRPGTMVKTPDGYHRAVLVGHSIMINPGHSDRSQHRLYICRTDQYPELKTDLYLTGCHSILVDQLSTDQIEKTKELAGDVYITGQKYRLMACLDDRAEPWASEASHTVWHVALENQYPRANYGMFVNGGLLVETCSIQYLRNHSNMELIE